MSWSIHFSCFLCFIGVFFTYAMSQTAEYPTYHEVPKGLTFSCRERGPGYFADPETQCQVWHWCIPSGGLYSFLCPNGTVFNQKFRVCDWWFNVDCAASSDLYRINDDLYKDKDGNYISGKDDYPNTQRVRRRTNGQHRRNLSARV